MGKMKRLYEITESLKRGEIVWNPEKDEIIFVEKLTKYQLPFYYLSREWISNMAGFTVWFEKQKQDTMNDQKKDDINSVEPLEIEALINEVNQLTSEQRKLLNEKVFNFCYMELKLNYEQDEKGQKYFTKWIEEVKNNA